MILSFLRKDPAREAGAILFEAAAEAARDPMFFADWGVDDTPEGRFEVQSVFVALLLDRLAAEGSDAARLAQAVSEAMFDRLDAALRELGVGDLSVSKRIRKLAEGFYGRAGAYRAALRSETDEALEAAIARNVFGQETAPHALALARHMRVTARSLGEQTFSRLNGGIVTFPAPRSQA